MLREFADSSQTRVEPFAHGVVAAGHADVVGNPQSAIPEPFIHSVRRGVITGKDRSYAFTAGYQGFRCEVSDFGVVLRVHTQVVRRLPSIVHRLSIAGKASREPWKMGISYEPYVTMAQAKKVASHFTGPTRFIGINQVPFGYGPEVEDVIAECDIGQSLVLEQLDQTP